MFRHWDLSTILNDHRQYRCVARACLATFNQLKELLTLQQLSKDGVTAIQPRSWDTGNKELGSISIGS